MFYIAEKKGENLRHLNLTVRLFWYIAAFIIGATLLITLYLYHQAQLIAETRALARAHSLQSYFSSMRYVYHHQFLNSGLDLNDSTVGFLPAHAASRISDEFSKRSPDGVTIRNVSDRPRNPANNADGHERDAIRLFSQNPELKEHFTTIRKNGEAYFFYAAPIRIEPYCLQCHGKKKEVHPYIARRYDTAYGYQVGDVRGLTSINIPKKHLEAQSMSIFWKEALFGWGVIFFLLGLIYYAIRDLTRNEAESKKRLQAEVKRQTAELAAKTIELQEANHHQRYLFSVLRTVADANQILITARSLEELLFLTARCIAANDAFVCVAISLVEEGELRLKEVHGIGEGWELLPLDHQVLAENRSILLSDIHNILSGPCVEFLRQHDITALYAAPLKKDSHAEHPFGVMTICTAQENGFSGSEKEMLDELSGDLGFAINSFFQKEDIVKLSYYDSLTELPNRHLLMERFSQALKSSTRTHHYGALLFVDLDNFKGVNDLKGHLRGDIILKEMGQRFVSALRESDTVSRFGGDEFVILLENLGSDSQAAARGAQWSAQKILGTAKEPFFIDNQPFYLTASIGIVLFDGEKVAPEDLFAHADSAMYAAKNSGRNTLRFYDALLQEAMASQAKMLQDLRLAVEQHLLYLAYQEQVDHEGRTVGVEVLLRWDHPEHGPIPPSQFIPLAEESGIIIPLGAWILEQSIRQIKCWSDDPLRHSWRVSVNVSPRQFEQNDFVPSLKRLLEEAQIDPAKLRLELTEGLLIREADKAMAKINELKALGLTLSIDDFGTGYSSLSYLKHLPIDELKIDQSFVRALPQSGSDETIVKTMIAMAEAFGLEVIAEGVETAEQFESLKGMGCRLFQGYLFSRPQKSDMYTKCLPE